MIQSYTPTLSFIGFRKQKGVAMPVVTIELNNNPSAGYKSIHHKLTSYGMLWDVLNIHAIQQLVTGEFEFVRLEGLLQDVQLKQHGSPFGIVISASKGAIGNVVLTRLATRKRPTECFTAHLTDMLGFVPALPLVSVFSTTEEHGCSYQPTSWDVSFLATNSTSLVLPFFLGRTCTGFRAVFAGFTVTTLQTVDKLLATHLTSDSWFVVTGNPLADQTAILTPQLQERERCVKRFTTHPALYVLSCAASGACSTGLVMALLRTVVASCFDFPNPYLKSRLAIDAGSNHVHAPPYIDHPLPTNYTKPIAVMQRLKELVTT